MVEKLARLSADEVEKMSCLLAGWHAKLKNWHVLQHVGTFIGMPESKNEKLARRHVGTSTTLSCKHVVM